MPVTPKVEIGFSKAVAGTFRIGVSLIGGGDVLSNRFSQFFDGAADDVTADAEQAVIRRGRTDLLGAMQAGELELTLCRPDDLDYYNPASAASPLNTGNDPGFKPMRPVRVTATLDAVDYPLFYGFLRSARYDPETRRCTVYAGDLMLWLSRIRPTIAATGPTTTGAAIGLILDAAEWTEPAMRSLAAGDSIPDFSADGTQSALELIEDLLLAERGVFFIAGDGVATYHDRHERARRTSAQSLLSDVAVEVTPGFDLDGIRNRITVTRAGGLDQTAESLTSQQDYGLADATAIASPYLSSDAQAASLASYLVGLLSTPRDSARVTLDGGTDDDLLTQLSRELGDRVYLDDPLSGTAGDFHIEQIEHVLSDQGLRLETRYLLTERGLQAFVIGTSTIGGSDVLTY